MADFVASVLVVAAFAASVHLFAPRPGARAAALLERYRPHAPMADWSLSFRDEQRQCSDIAAISARRDADVEFGRMVDADAADAEERAAVSSMIRPARGAHYRLDRLRQAVQF
ncbi:hypothetical protein ABIA39_002834 [Nocardia sp. GAS34]|uniref:hypothetical protein n=1 Tax=unclassified Nocardia TaxID=2637762 RepID=UPI003D1A3C59